MDNGMRLRQLVYQVKTLSNGLKIQTGQANLVYVENQELKRKIDRLQIELAKLTAKSEGMVAIGANGTKQY